MSDERIVLIGDAAIELWKQGRVAWNRWVDANPVADVSFEDVDFGEHIQDGGAADFEGFAFPNGAVVFHRTRFRNGARFLSATFGDGDVSFEDATFGDGNISFVGATFGKGSVYFLYATFGDGRVDFGFTTFGRGDVLFFRATFGKGSVSFRNAAFGDGIVSFYEATFGHGDVSFADATFGDGDVSFREATFGRGNVSFANVTFGDGGVTFSKATFEDGDVSFARVTFGDGAVRFSETTFGDCTVNFIGAQAKGPFVFQLTPTSTPTSVKSLCLSMSKFDGVFVLQGRFTCIPDLRSTITQGHVDLQNLRVDPWTLNWSWPWIGFSKDPDNDVPALRRLKELAEANRHHDAALRFFADERRAMRWNKEHLSKTASLLEWAYDWLCRYGQSVGRPAIGLASLLILFAAVYALKSPAPLSISVKALEALYASTSNILPFIPAAFDIRRSAFDDLYPCGIPPLIDGLRLAQGLFGFLFLFLIGLGLRNRFRM